MILDESSTIKKALGINLDPQLYGTFAEIGAGQEIARHFFKAGLASQTVAKTISAYDMTFSDEIYGKEKSGRYVVESRLNKMLEKEYRLLQKRLHEQRGKKTRFFAFANTVTTSSDDGRRKHGWLGIRFQTKPQSEPHDIVLHANFLDQARLQQQDCIGILGVNLIDSALHFDGNLENFVKSLVDNLGRERVEIDMLKFSGPSFKKVDNRLVGLELVKQGLTHAMMFSPQGEVVHAADHLFNKPVLIQRGTYRPVTTTDVDILNHGIKHTKAKSKNLQVILEISMSKLKQNGEVNTQDFLNRIEALSLLGHSMMISDFLLFYELKNYLKYYTRENIFMVIGASHLEKLFTESYYKHLDGGILAAFGQLFDDNTKLLVFPFKTENLCKTAKTFNPKSKLKYLFQHLLHNKYIEDIFGCDDIDTTIHSETVRELLKKKNKKWEQLVPEEVKDFIKKKRLFRDSK